jgi:hypothetical protein
MQLFFFHIATLNMSILKSEVKPPMLETLSGTASCRLVVRFTRVGKVTTSVRLKDQTATPLCTGRPRGVKRDHAEVQWSDGTVAHNKRKKSRRA